MFMLHPINRGAGGGNGKGNSGNKGNGSGNADYMYLEYRGKASDSGSPCASTGLPGDATGNGPLVPTLSR